MKKMLLLFVGCFLALNVFAQSEITFNAMPPADGIAQEMQITSDNPDVTNLIQNLTTASNIEESQLLAAAQAQLASSGNDRITAAVLAILLGAFGVQHFYLGQTVRGILDILFCWTGIPELIGLIEGIIWLLQDDATFAANH